MSYLTSSTVWGIDEAHAGDCSLIYEYIPTPEGGGRFRVIGIDPAHPPEVWYYSVDPASPIFTQPPVITDPIWSNLI